MKKMKFLIIGTVVSIALIALFSIETNSNHFAGYSQMVKRVIGDKNSDSVHDLDLTKYRPNMPNR